jgi:hypothetical protein
MLFQMNLKDSKNKGMCRNFVEIEKHISLVYTSYKTL